MSSLFLKLFAFVNTVSVRRGIDESHGIMHSMNTLHFVHHIYESEKYEFPILQKQENVIYVSAVLHDMCDKKYMNETEGIEDIELLLHKKISEDEILATKNIISTMSYSKVKKCGYPDLGDYQLAYHIVREADLLAAYDFDRSMIYHMRRSNCDINEAYKNAHMIFVNRVLRHNFDNLFVTDFSKKKSVELHYQAIQRMMTWKKLLKI
jgi:hypothetical protein